jgi:hypothetical protein
LSELEKQYQDSVKEAESSFKKRENIHEPTTEQKAQALDIIGRLEKLHNELVVKSNLTHKIEGNAEFLSPAMIEYWNGIAQFLDECATEADRLRIRIERDRETKDLSLEFQRSRSEDLATMIRALDGIEKQISTLIGTYDVEIKKQAAHREKEDETLKILRDVLKRYQR